jgi:hypothetical protein
MIVKFSRELLFIDASPAAENKGISAILGVFAY